MAPAQYPHAEVAGIEQHHPHDYANQLAEHPIADEIEQIETKHEYLKYNARNDRRVDVGGCGLLELIHAKDIADCVVHIDLQARIRRALFH